MITINDFAERFQVLFSDQANLQPWEVTDNLATILYEMILNLDSTYLIKDGIAIHKSATIENNVVLKAPIIISENCFISANSYFRGPVYLDNSVIIGSGCEIKQSLIFENTAIAHFNYIGNSIVGSSVNFEAGSIAANHYNERIDKTISIIYNNKIINSYTQKFGSLVGDKSRIGANAVLSPGTILNKNSIVKRLELIDQLNGK